MENYGEIELGSIEDLLTWLRLHGPTTMWIDKLTGELRFVVNEDINGTMQ